MNEAYEEYLKMDNVEAINRCGCDILIGTPGRLKHFMGPIEKFVSSRLNHARHSRVFRSSTTS